MALASWRVQIIKRSTGRSAVAAAAYRSAQTLYDERTGLTHSYARKTDVLHTEILAPAAAPEWVYDPYQLWNRSESLERRDDAQTAREVRIALPRELTQEQNIELARSFGQVFVNQGMVAHVSVHDKGDGNPHAHIMLTMRPLDGDGFSKKKNRDWNKTDRLLEWHKEYELLTNQYLERYGYKERIDIRSYAAQGIDQIPTIHLGPYAHRMKQQGVYTERWEINQRIEEQNKELAEISKQIERYEKEAEQLENEIAQEQKWKQGELEKQDAKAQEISEPEPASIHHNGFLERYMMVAQSIHKTEEAQQDILTEKGIQDFVARGKNAGDIREPLPQPTQEQDTPPLHTRGEESEQKRQKQQEYETLYEAAKQKRKEHRIVRDPERQNRRYQDAYERAEERDRKISRIEQTTDHRRSESPKPERQPDFQEQYRIAERRHHELERQERRYSRSRDEPEHEK